MMFNIIFEVKNKIILPTEILYPDTEYRLHVAAPTINEARKEAERILTHKHMLTNFKIKEIL